MVGSQSDHRAVTTDYSLYSNESFTGTFATPPLSTEFGGRYLPCRRTTSSRRRQSKRTKEFSCHRCRISSITPFSHPTRASRTSTVCAGRQSTSAAGVCVNPVHVARCAENLKDEDVKVCAVVAFPFGASLSEVKACETRAAVRDGAQEVDVVINIGAAKDGRWDVVRDDVRAVVEAAAQAIKALHLGLSCGEGRGDALGVLLIVPQIGGGDLLRELRYLGAQPRQVGHRLNGFQGPVQLVNLGHEVCISHKRAVYRLGPVPLTG